MMLAVPCSECQRHNQDIGEVRALVTALRRIARGSRFESLVTLIARLLKEAADER
jgi:hypothetical protein